MLPLPSSAALLAVIFLVDYNSAQESTQCCCDCPLSPCPLELSIDCAVEPLTPCSHFKASRKLVSCTVLLGGRDMKATTHYEFVPIERVEATTPTTFLETQGSPDDTLHSPVLQPLGPVSPGQPFMDGVMRPDMTPPMGMGGYTAPYPGIGISNEFMMGVGNMVRGIMDNVRHFVNSLTFGAGGNFRR